MNTRLRLKRASVARLVQWAASERRRKMKSDRQNHQAAAALFRMARDIRRVNQRHTRMMQATRLLIQNLREAFTDAVL